jgi:hypothetical protein
MTYDRCFDARARAPGRPEPGAVPSGDRSRYAASEGAS